MIVELLESEKPTLFALMRTCWLTYRPVLPSLYRSIHIQPSDFNTRNPAIKYTPGRNRILACLLAPGRCTLWRKQVRELEITMPGGILPLERYEPGGSWDRCKLF